MKKPGHDKTLVVLGAAVWPGGIASPTLKRRSEWAGQLFKRGGCDVIVLSGGVGKHGPAEADVMAAILLASGIPQTCLVLDRAARVTLDTAAFAARMPNGLQRQFVAVTDLYHAPRTWLAFRAFRLQVVTSSPPLGRATDLRQRIASFAREIPALILYSFYFFRTRRQENRAQQ